MSEVIVVSGSGTGVGKTIATAALAAISAASGSRVAVVKPVQTGTAAGEPRDIDEVNRLAGPSVTTCEVFSYPDPLAPLAAARTARQQAPDFDTILREIERVRDEHDLVFVEGAGGLLVRLDVDGKTVADLANELSASVLLVVGAELGTLNVTALSAEALASRDVVCRGVVIGRWPSQPALPERNNLIDLPLVAEAPLLGLVPDGAARLKDFAAQARKWFAPTLGGEWSVNL